MAVHTIVALFPSRTEAENAKHQLEAIGIPSVDIALGAGDEAAAEMEAGTAGGAGRREWGFFEWLFGAEAPESDIARYRSHIEDRGGAALSVRAQDRDHDRIIEVLE